MTGLAKLLVMCNSHGGCDKVSAVLENIVYCTTILLVAAPWSVPTIPQLSVILNKFIHTPSTRCGKAAMLEPFLEQCLTHPPVWAWYILHVSRRRFVWRSLASFWHKNSSVSVSILDDSDRSLLGNCYKATNFRRITQRDGRLVGDYVQSIIGASLRPLSANSRLNESLDFL